MYNWAKIFPILTWTNRVFISQFLPFFKGSFHLVFWCSNFFWDFPAAGISIDVMTVMTNFVGT